MNKFQEIITNANKIAVFSHINPDADALCSSFALKNIIRNNFEYKFVDVFIDGELGELYDPILRNEVINPIPYASYDLAIVLDCPNTSRLGRFETMLENIPEVINLDHHSTNIRFGDMNYASNKISSTCELVYLLAKNCGFELNNTIAKELYQGIITDTNCFTSLSTARTTHRVLDELLGYKFNSDLIKEYYFKNNTKAKTKLLAKTLNSIKYCKNGTVAIMEIPFEEFQKCNATFEDTLGIVDQGVNIDGVKLAALFIEKEPEQVYVSLRSKGEVAVGEIAKTFGGGGNETQAAFQYSGQIKEISKAFSDFVKMEVNLQKDPDSIKLF